MFPVQETVISKPDGHQMMADQSLCPWVLVAGGFHRNGGMDKANLALAQYLVEQGSPVYLVCHSVDPELAQHPLITVNLVSRPAGSFFLGRPLLDICGRRIARKVTSCCPRARVVINGNNCLWPGINWVHYVHHAWKPKQQEGPFWFRVKEALSSWLARKREGSAARVARVFITNSNRTSRDVINLGVEPERVRTVYLGAESDWGLVTREEKAASKKCLKIPEERPVAVFIGSLGFDHRKGFDILFKAWKKLCANPDWDVDLLVAGSGNALPMWREELSRIGLSHRIRVIGFTDRVQDLLAAADLLVSPVRYEAYGLNVQEAICRGVPAIVSAEAGVAERYGPALAPLLLPDPEDVADLVGKLLRWRSERELWSARFEQLAEELRGYSWRDMARRLVSIASEPEVWNKLTSRERL
jgi:glycosyltransferase involved in cell wall biosynthesis